MEIKINTYLLPSGGVYYDFNELTFKLPSPEVLPAEPEVIPQIAPVQKPSPDDPWHVEKPKIWPTPKGLSFF